MLYTIKKENRSTLKNFGKYKMCAVHPCTVTQKQIEEEINNNCSARPSDVKLVLTELSDVINRHLRAGRRVRLDNLGLLKLEIESVRHDHPDDFNIPEDIRAVRLHFLPEKYRGRKPMYSEIDYQLW